jgi:hypothetical protein
MHCDIMKMHMLSKKPPKLSIIALYFLIALGFLYLGYRQLSSSSDFGDGLMSVFIVFLVLFGLIPVLWVAYTVMWVKALRSKSPYRKSYGLIVVLLSFLLLIQIGGVSYYYLNEKSNEEKSYLRSQLELANFTTYEPTKLPEGNVFQNAFYRNSSESVSQDKPKDVINEEVEIMYLSSGGYLDIRQYNISNINLVSECATTLVVEYAYECNEIARTKDNIPVFFESNVLVPYFDVSVKRVPYYVATIGSTRIKIHMYEEVMSKEDVLLILDNLKQYKKNY